MTIRTNRAANPVRTLSLLGLSLLAGCVGDPIPEEEDIPGGEDNTPTASVKKEPLNILLITADDLNCSTTPMFGCNVPDLMPNIERFAKEGMLFRKAHIVSGASQVSRGGIMTGLYPHNSGIDGFYQTTKNIPTVQETFLSNGYRIGIIGKVEHSTPKASIEWDMTIQGKELKQGRDPQVFYDKFREFVEQCQADGKPFFFMANSLDPHRPFAGSQDEISKMGKNRVYPNPERFYTPGEIERPGFLPDLPDIMLELSHYYNSVGRLDQTVGQVLKVLSDTEMESNTMVVFLSDNGMSMPFAKTNSYLHSTHTPLIIRYPGTTTPGSEDNVHFVNGIDLMPTFFEAAGIAIPSGLDGSSFFPLLSGKGQAGREYVFTEFTENSGRNREPIRAIQNQKYGYIYNVWSNGYRVFKSETTSGLTFNAMKAAAATSESISERVEFFKYRVCEEFYDYQADPDALVNLIDDPAYHNTIEQFRSMMENHLERTNDPVLAPFRNRYDKQFVKKYMDEQDAIVANR